MRWVILNQRELIEILEEHGIRLDKNTV
jgi:hypothetical protein